jgi:hypothetical protein
MPQTGSGKVRESPDSQTHILNAKKQLGTHALKNLEDRMDGPDKTLEKQDIVDDLL